METGKTEVTPRQEETPPPPTERPDSLGARAMRWLRRELATVGIGTVFTVAAFLLTDYLWPREERFRERLAAERAILEDPEASEDARINAARELARLPGDDSQAAVVVEFLRVFVEGRTRPGPGAEEPCGSAAGGAVPRYVSHALVAWGEVAREVGGGARIRLPGADLRGVEAADASLRGADLSDACLAGARLDGADLSGATLRDAVLQGASLVEADLAGARLNGACLARADLTGADLRGAHLTGVDLSLALVAGASLAGADLANATLAGAYLAGTELRGVEHWEEVGDFDTAYLGEAAGMPEGLARLAGAGGAVVDRLAQREWLEVRDAFAGRRGLGAGRCR